MIDISKCNKAAVLKALYDNSQPQGMGFLHYNPRPLTLEEAERALNQSSYIDYFNGRVIKVDLRGDLLDPTLYDRDNGQGAAYNTLKNAGLI